MPAGLWACTLEHTADASAYVNLKSGKDLGMACWKEKVRTVQVGAYPVTDRVNGEMLDSQPWPKDGMGEEALCEVGVRRSWAVVHVPEPGLTVWAYLANFQDRSRATWR